MSLVDRLHATVAVKLFYRTSTELRHGFSKSTFVCPVAQNVQEDVNRQNCRVGSRGKSRVLTDYETSIVKLHMCCAVAHEMHGNQYMLYKYARIYALHGLNVSVDG